MGDRPELDDAELVRRTREGDERAFGMLVRRYRRAAYSVALAVTGGHEDAEDAAQEAFLVALERLEDCRRPERFAAWLLTIVRNRGRNLRRRERRREGEPIPSGLTSGDPGPGRKAEQAELRRRLRTAMAQLSGVQREVVLLHDLEGWKHREIADRLAMPPGTVRSHLHYARKELRNILTNDGFPEPEERAG